MARNDGRDGRLRSRYQSMRRLENYVRKYGPEFGPVLFHALQSQAAHAGVSARLRRKIAVLSGQAPAEPKKTSIGDRLPLFPERSGFCEVETREVETREVGSAELPVVPA